MSAEPSTEPPSALLSVEDVSVEFQLRGRGHARTRAVTEVSVTVDPGEMVALVGESGSGKTTLGFTILGRYQPTRGRVVFDGHDVTHANPRELRELRRHMQMVFQDPFSSMNDRMRVCDVVGEPLQAYGLVSGRAQLRARVGESLERCGMSASVMDRYPTEFSGGQRQRIAIARALALGPKLVVADEPTSALDVSVQAQILNLFRDLQRDLGIAFVIVSHDLAVVRHVSERVAVMLAGRLVELAPTEELFRRPQHPYTQRLLASIPLPEPVPAEARGRAAATSVATRPPASPPACPYRTRCELATDRCAEMPGLDEHGNGHIVACWAIEPSRPSAVGVPDPRTSPPVRTPSTTA